MFTPQVLYVSPRLRGALTEDQFGALEVIEYIEHRIGRIIRPISVPMPEPVEFGPAAPALPPAFIASTAMPSRALH